MFLTMIMAYCMYKQYYDGVMVITVLYTIYATSYEVSPFLGMYYVNQDLFMAILESWKNILFQP